MTAPRIRRLPRELINKIAAGEVVERPASVVKELVENTIDAEASRVEVALEDGGKKLIRVVDDGVGMSPADLALAFASHATSKIAETEDLFRIDTLGFRGEALASIASVSRCRIVSRERGGAEAASIGDVGGRAGEVRACGAPEGTILEVRDLFFNTPARLKFLRTAATELRHAAEVVTRLALPCSALAVSLTHNGKPVLRLPPATSPRERAAALLGESLCDGLLSVHSETAAMAVTGLASPPGEGLVKPTQYVFLNGRYVRDRAISRAIAEAYRSRLPRGRYPTVILHLQLDPARVDVNVHPTKIEVRFRDPGAVFAQVLTAIEKALRSAGPAARPEKREAVRRAIGDFFEHSQQKAEVRRTGPGSPGQFDAARKEAYAIPDSPAGGLSVDSAAAVERPPSKPESGRPGTAELPFDHTTEPAHVAPPLPSRTFCQIRDSYIIEEAPDGFLVIDQHALHERILYDELRRRVGHAAVPRQRLLVPEIVDLQPEDFLRVMEMRDSLLRVGVEVEPFGERTVAVRAVPHVAGATSARELILEFVREAREGAPGRLTDREEMLMRVIACKAAVKAGERLTQAQVEALLDRRDRIGPEPTCPHGRPTTLRFAFSDLEKRFRRK